MIGRRMSVLSSILSGEYLQNTVRVIGGAYGGFSGISSDGNFYFASSRSKLKETLITMQELLNMLNHLKLTRLKCWDI